MGFVFIGAYGLGFGRQPLRLGARLLGGSLGIAGMMGCFRSSWLGFLILMVYVGGILVIFSYVCCLASNCVYFRPSLFGFLAWMGLVVVQFVFVVSLKLGRPSVGGLVEGAGLLEGGKVVVRAGRG